MIIVSLLCFWFVQVTAYDDTNGWFTVLYDDGDTEEYNLAELQELMKATSKVHIATNKKVSQPDCYTIHSVIQSVTQSFNQSINHSISHSIIQSAIQ